MGRAGGQTGAGPADGRAVARSSNRFAERVGGRGVRVDAAQGDSPPCRRCGFDRRRTALGARHPRAGARLRAQSRVSDLMTSDVVTTTPDATIRRIANVMRGRTIGCIPVMDGKRPVGIVTVSDLLQLLGRGIDRPARPDRPRRAGRRHAGPARSRDRGGELHCPVAQRFEHRGRLCRRPIRDVGELGEFAAPLEVV